MAIEIYKRTQGKYTRWVTFGVGVLLGVMVAEKVSDYAAGLPNYATYGIPTLIVVGVAALMFWIINRPASADFMINTENEMKKVSWSSRKEVIGGTKVVIATTLILAAILLAVDLGFGFFFRWIGVLQVGAGS
jgi:preprotein translocase SecE subunit